MRFQYATLYVVIMTTISFLSYWCVIVIESIVVLLLLFEYVYNLDSVVLFQTTQTHAA